MRALLALFIIIPIIELWLLIQVGSHIGAVPTIFLVFLTAVVGLALLRQQGLATLLRVNQRMEQGRLPATEILEGVALAVGGALLLTPGFITDGIGFICLIPSTRKLLIATVLQRGLAATLFKSQQSNSRRSNGQAHTYNKQSQDDNSGPTTLEGEYRRED